MNLLLDTSVVIDINNIDLGPMASSVLFVSAVSVAELAFGLDTDDPLQRSARYERFYWTLEECDVVDFDLVAAKHYGTLCALVRQAGRNPRPRRFDLQIAATAAAQGLPLLTRNPDDFKGIERLVDVMSV